MKLLVLTPATLMMPLMIAAAAVVQAGGSGAATGSSGCRGDSALRCAAPAQNCSTVLQAAIDAAAGVGGSGALCIGGTWAVLPIALRSNLLLQLTADATVIAQRGAFHGGADHLVNVLGVRNVSIRGAVGGGSRLAMWKSDYTDTKLYSHSEGRHALCIMESRHVRVSDLEIEDPGGDSVYLGGSVGGGPATDVELLRVVSRNAYRNGLSITGARDVVVQSCSFLNTSGTPPEAGIDIEPNDPSNWIHNISFYDLQSRWNRGSGISLALGKLSCAKLRRPCHHPAECVCPKDPPAVTITVAGAQIQGVSELGLNGSSMIQGLDFNIGVFISAGLNESRGSFNFSDVSVNETVQPGLEFEDKAALNLPVRFVNCSWSHVATAKTVRWGGQNVPLLLHQAEYNAIGGITFDHCSVGDGAEARPWLKCDSCGSRGPALGITGDVTVTNSAGCRTDNVPAGGLAITCDRVPASTSQLKSDDSAVSPLELFVRYSGDLQKPTALPTVLAMMDKARACGYDGMLYDDSAIPSLHIKGRTNATFYSNWDTVRSHAERIGLKLNLAIFPFGYSASIFSQPGYGYQLAEPLKFSGARFRVASDKTHLVPASMYGGIDNGGFDSHNGDLIKGWKQDAPSQRTFVESGQTCRSGGSCLRIGPGARDAQVWQEMRGVGKLSQVQVSFWAKSSAFAATQYNVELRSLLNRGNDSTTARGRRLSWSWLNVNRTQDWAQYHFVATTWDDREPVALFIGFEQRADGPAPVQQGSIFFDDISVAETAFINVLEREGAPLVARAGNRVLSEGQDFDRVVDPMYPRGLWPQYEAGTSWFSCQWPADGYPDTHPTPVVTLPNSTILSPGEVVTFDYFAVLPVLGSVPSCLTHPAIAQYMHESAGAVALLQPSGMLMSYDEIHIMRNDHDEMSRFATAGELLASHVANATKIARSAVNTAKRKNNSAPNVRLFAWADMFNPDHNSGNHYFLVNGTLEGAWRGIERGLEGVTMMTWGPCNDSAPSKPGQPPCKYRAGLEFFADRGIHQFLGGYYDTHDGTKSARDEWSYQKGVRNVDGFMYTTWGSNNPQNGGLPDYTQMCPYAKELRRLHDTCSGKSWKWRGRRKIKTVHEKSNTTILY